MRTKIILGAVVTVIAASSLYAAGAYCDNSNNSARYGMNNQHMQGYNMHNQQGTHYQGKKGFHMQKMFQALNLTPTQQTKIDAIINKHRNSRTMMSDAFTKSDFDKEKFIKFASEKRENMIKSRADMIEGIYNILTNEQKLQFKVLIDLKMNHINKRLMSDKHSYGRR